MRVEEGPVYDDSIACKGETPMCSLRPPAPMGSIPRGAVAANHISVNVLVAPAPAPAPAPIMLLAVLPLLARGSPEKKNPA